METLEVGDNGGKAVPPAIHDMEEMVGRRSPVVLESRQAFPDLIAISVKKSLGQQVHHALWIVIVAGGELGEQGIQVGPALCNGETSAI